MATYKVGVIGAGFTAEQYHIPAWNQIDKCKVLAVCDVNENRLGSIQKKFQIKDAYVDYKDMLADGGLDIITVATPSYCHYEQIINSLNRGMHVVVEKPMALSYGECIDAIKVSGMNHRKLMCLQQNRFKKSTIKLQEIISDGKLGEIYYAKATSVRSRGVPAAGHFTFESARGGGPLYDSGAHIIDIAWYLMGKPRLKSVVASSWNKLAASNTITLGDRIINSNNYLCEDMVAAHLTFVNGSVLSIEISYLANMPFVKKSECLFFGTSGGAYWPDAELYTNHGDKVVTRKLDVSTQYSLGAEMFQSFVNSIARDEEVAIAPHDSAEVIGIIQRIHEACSCSRPISLSNLSDMGARI
ncbi:MAG: Gfo/Idh/MocA family protein [Gammaproteobacteria bacterium]